MSSNSNDKRLLLGLFLLIIGGLLLSFNLDVLPYDFRQELRRLFWHWPMILIIIGMIHILGKDHKSPGIILLIIGLIFISPRWFDIPFRFQDIFWPLIFILSGFVILIRGKKHPKKGPWCKESHTIEDYQDKIDDLAFFGGSEKIISSQNFKGGKITCVFGGINYNMKRSRLSQGSNNIDVFTVFGGTKIIVPDDWNIKINVTSIFGGFADKRSVAPTTVIEKDKELVIRGVAIFGGGEIKNF